MKKALKQVLMFAAFVATPMTMSAQLDDATTVSQEIYWYYSVPKQFTYDGSVLLAGRIYDDSGTMTFHFYNDEFEEVKKLTIPQNVERIEYVDFDNNSTPEINFYASQTMFNKDEKFEYVLPISEGEKDNLVGFRIMSEDGTELQTIMLDVPSRDWYDWGIIALNINKKLYFIVVYETSDSNISIVYRINQQTNEIKPVANIPVSFAGRYSVDGQRLTKAQRGINIVRKDDGTVSKVLVK